MHPGCCKAAFYTLAAMRLSAARIMLAALSTPWIYPKASPGTSAMEGAEGTLIKAEHVRRCSQSVITVAHIHRCHRHRWLLTMLMSKHRPPQGVICSCSSRLIWDVKLQHLNKSLLQFLAPADRPTCLSKMSAGKKTSWPIVERF